MFRLQVQSFAALALQKPEDARSLCSQWIDSSETA